MGLSVAASVFKAKRNSLADSQGLNNTKRRDSKSQTLFKSIKQKVLQNKEQTNVSTTDEGSNCCIIIISLEYLNNKVVLIVVNFS